LYLCNKAQGMTILFLSPRQPTVSTRVALLHPKGNSQNVLKAVETN